MQDYNDEHGYDLTNKGTVVFVKMGLFSDTVTDIGALEKGMTIAIPEDSSQASRALMFLADEDIVSLDDSFTEGSGLDLVAENPYELQFIQKDIETIALEGTDVDLFVTTADRAYLAGYDYSAPLAKEAAKSDNANYFSSVVAVANFGESELRFDKLIKALRTYALSTYVENHFDDCVYACFFADENHLR